MAHDPWFKAYSAEVLTDEKMDEIPREAEGLLWRMWCVCNLRGSIPSDHEEISRLTCCKLSYVSYYVSYTLPFFDVKDGRLFSHRMEKEKAKSAKARESVSHRKDRQSKSTSTNRITERSEERTTQNSEFRIQIEPIALSDENRSPLVAPIYTLPCTSSQEYGVLGPFYEKMCLAYPGVDVKSELRKMSAWLEANPTKKKTIKGIPRFINSWLANAQDNQPRMAGPTRIPAKKYKTAAESLALMGVTE